MASQINDELVTTRETIDKIKKIIATSSYDCETCCSDKIRFLLDDIEDEINVLDGEQVKISSLIAKAKYHDNDFLLQEIISSFDSKN